MFPVTDEYRRQPGGLFACGPMPVDPAPILKTQPASGAKRLLAIVCRTTFLPFRDFPHEWVKPSTFERWGLAVLGASRRDAVNCLSPTNAVTTVFHDYAIGLGWNLRFHDLRATPILLDKGVLVHVGSEAPRA